MTGVLLGTIVEWDALGETVLSALVAGTVVTLTFSAAIWGATRAADLRRDGHTVESTLVGLIGAVALLLALGAVVLGLIVMVS